MAKIFETLSLLTRHYIIAKNERTEIKLFDDL